MSCFCQFCDKSMMFEKQATHVGGYITCGAPKCQQKARYNLSLTDMEERAKKIHRSRFCVFSTKTPEVDSTWRIVEQKLQPNVLENTEVMSFMVLGHYVFDEESKLYYMIKPAADVMKDVAIVTEAVPDA